MLQAVLPLILSHVYADIFDDFFSSYSNARDTAERLQASVAQWMAALP